MELDPQEQIWARNWFYGAGTAAILLSFFLPFVDYKLSNSDREIEVAETLREMRTAQFGLGSRNIDHRLTAEAAAPAPRAAGLAQEAPAGHEAEAEDHEAVASAHAADAGAEETATQAETSPVEESPAAEEPAAVDEQGAAGAAEDSPAH